MAIELQVYLCPCGKDYAHKEDAENCHAYSTISEYPGFACEKCGKLRWYTPGDHHTITAERREDCKLEAENCCGGV